MAYKTKLITSFHQLIEQSNKGNHEYFISNGILRSSKYIQYDPTSKLFLITNEIDNSEQELTAVELMDTSITLIGHAINNNKLYMY